MKAMLLSAVVILAAGCGRGDREVRLKRLQVQRQGLTEQFERLQARLLVDRERVRFWTEMRERSAGAIAITCGAEEEADVARAARLLPQAASRRPAHGAIPARLVSLHRPGTADHTTP